MPKKMPKITPLKKSGPITLGRQSGGYVVCDARTESIQWYSDKPFATKVYNNKVANLVWPVATKEEAPAPEEAPTDQDAPAVPSEADYLRTMREALWWLAHSEWQDRRLR